MLSKIRRTAEAMWTVAVVYVHGMSMSLKAGHLPSWARVDVLVSVCAHVPLMILYAPEFTMLQHIQWYYLYVKASLILF